MKCQTCLLSVIKDINSSNMHKLLLFLVVITLIASCETGSNEKTKKLASTVVSDSFTVIVDTLSTNLTAPWGMAFLPNGDILITEKAGQLKIFRDGEFLPEPVKGLPEIKAMGQGGLLDVELHPEYESNGWVYLSYSDPGEGRGGNTAIIRAKLRDNELVDVQKLFRAQPDSEKGQHWGSRIEFDKDGYMYFSVGDRGRHDISQNLDNHFGKTFRLHDDGKVPDDNPFAGQPGAKPEIFSYGHRNIQGMSRNPRTGDIWTHEHGPQGGDEINIIKPGRNYGWPVITYGINYDGTIITEDTVKEGMEQPVLFWRPSIAPCGMTFITSDKYKGRYGDLLVGSLKFRYLEYCKIDGDKVVSQQKLIENTGRVRAVEISPDGYIYVLTEAPGLLLKLLPEGEATELKAGAGT